MEERVKVVLLNLGHRGSNGYCSYLSMSCKL
jgi:hypothetical protein